MFPSLLNGLVAQPNNWTLYSLVVRLGVPKATNHVLTKGPSGYTIRLELRPNSLL